MHSQFLIASDPVVFANDLLGFHPDPEQARFLSSSHPRRALNCTRQSGKSTLSAVLAVRRFVFGPPDNFTLIRPRPRRPSSLMTPMVTPAHAARFGWLGPPSQTLAAELLRTFDNSGSATKTAAWSTPARISTQESADPRLLR